ncbi:hypothetical protein AMK23_33725 [Streptomyces sp. CB02130]|nr:hypothetical protein AMK23_33725 [Streptomyces sp. CB02130]
MHADRAAEVDRRRTDVLKGTGTRESPSVDIHDGNGRSFILTVVFWVGHDRLYRCTAQAVHCGDADVIVTAEGPGAELERSGRRSFVPGCSRPSGAGRRPRSGSGVMPSSRIM